MSSQKGSLKQVENLKELLPLITAAPIPEYEQPEFYLKILRPKLYLEILQATPFMGSCIEELEAFVLPTLGITRAQFDQESRKPFARLFYEWDMTDMDIFRTRKGEIVRLASNARTEIHAPLFGLSFQEIGRMYLESGIYDEHKIPKPHASSETLRRGSRTSRDPARRESPVDAAVRGLWDEHRRRVKPEELLPLDSGRGPRVPSISDAPSSAFARMRSVVVSWRFRHNIRHPRLWRSSQIRRVGKNHFCVRDEDVDLHLSWLTVQAT